MKNINLFKTKNFNLNSFTLKPNSIFNTQINSFSSLHKNLHVYMNGRQETESGMKVTIFGGNSAVGTILAREFLMRGTPVNFVHRNVFDIEIPFTHNRLLKKSNPFNANMNSFTDYNFTDDALKQTRPYGKVGMKSFTHLPDYLNDWEIENAIRGSNVVINCVGSSPIIRHDSDYEAANVLIPRKIAKVCAKLKNDPVKRFIHFSANGANPDSVSRMLKTKYLGELEVREHFPEATILRPTEILNHRIYNTFLG